MGDQRLWVRLVLAGVLASALVLGGCSGDDGRDGITIEGKSAYELAVDNGFVGTEAEWLASLKGTDGTPGSDAQSPVITALEGCAVCHGSTKGYDPNQTGRDYGHSTINQVEVSNAVVTPAVAPATGVTITFNVKVDDVNNDDFDGSATVYEYAASVVPNTIYQSSGVTYPVVNDFSRTSRSATILSNGSGNYTVTVTDAPTQANVTYLVTALPAVVGDVPQVSVVGHLNAPARSLVSNDSCINCHGDYIFTDSSRLYHNSSYGVEDCVVCHTRYNTTARNVAGSRLTAYVHGIHNAHNMPSGEYARTSTSKYHTTYPTYMENCSVCHDTPATLAAANNAQTDYWFCMSCHDTWEGFEFTSETAAPFKAYHLNLPATTNCLECHRVGGAAPNKVVVSDYHNGLFTGRSGLVYNGQDVSVVEGDKVNMQITGVAYEGTNLKVTWTAAYDGTAVNPCNTTVAVGAPIFHAGGAANTTTGQVASNLSILRAYGEGDDWTNADIGTSPGQPVATNLSTTNTQCVNNDATTIIALTPAELATPLTKAVVALQGKAQVKLPYTFDRKATAQVEAQSVIQVRSETPTREFVVGTGAAPAEARREIVDTVACLKCHVGSMYQHGGNRVDNIDMCVMCHNEASTEQNVRALDGVNASEAYDGQPGQTYGFKSFLHAVHSAGDEERGKITMCYRTNGVYVWGADEANIPNWPAVDVFGEPFHSGAAALVYGSSAPHGTGPVVETINGVEYKQVYRVHNFHTPTYPRALKDCAACHKAGTFGLPDPTKAVATTVNAGTVNYTVGAPPFTGADAASGTGTVLINGNQLDDSLEGASAAACMSCHQSVNNADQKALKAHAYQNGWFPQVFPEGRQTIIDYAQ